MACAEASLALGASLAQGGCTTTHRAPLGSHSHSALPYSDTHLPYSDITSLYTASDPPALSNCMQRRQGPESVSSAPTLQQYSFDQLFPPFAAPAPCGGVPSHAKQRLRQAQGQKQGQGQGQGQG